MAGQRLSLAIARYDRHMPFFDGTVTVPDGIDLTVYQVGQTASHRDGRNRHRRMLSDREWDAAEVSLSSYVMAKARGADIAAIPVFPRRLFSQSQMFVAADSHITSPVQLAGKRVALQSFQTTLAVLAKGDVQFEYGVDWTRITWLVSESETVAFAPAAGASIERLPEGVDPSALLEAGEVDALFHSHPPRAVHGGAIQRLFPDARGEEARYFAKHGYWPIMHVIAIDAGLAEREPWVCRALMDMFAEAKAVAADYLSDPNWSQLAWEQHLAEEQRGRLGEDLWPLGVAANRANLDRFIEYSHSQGLIDRPLEVDSLFAEPVRET